MLDYDAEAARYDETRGGQPRARAAARCIDNLLISRRMRILVVDGSIGMLGIAAARLPGRVARGDATALPLASDCVDATVTLWLLHLLASPEVVAEAVAEACRVVRPGGCYLTTVDKDGERSAGHAMDSRSVVTELAHGNGLRLTGEERFCGIGQRSHSDGSEPVYTMLRFDKS